jgi:MFS family permease
MTASRPGHGATAEKTPPRLFAAWYGLAVLLALVLLAYVDRQVITLAAAPMARDLALSDTELGLVQGLAFALFTMGATYPVSWAADRYDRRWVLAGCVLLWSVGTAACAFVRSFDQLFLAAMAIAAGEAAVTPIALATVPDLFAGPRRVTAFLVFYAASTMGGSLAWLLGGSAFAAIGGMEAGLPHALASSGHWRLAFLIVAAPAPFLLLALRGLPARTDMRIAPGDRSVAMLPYLKAHGGTLALLLGGIGAIGFTLGAMLAWAPVAMARRFGLTPDVLGWGMGAAMAMGTAAGLLLAGAALRRLAARHGLVAGVRMAALAALFVAPSALLLTVAGHAGFVFVLIGVQMIGGTIIGATAPNLLQAIAPAALRSRVIAIYTISYVGANGLGALLAGLISDASGAGPAGILHVLGLVGLAGWLAGASLFRLTEPSFARAVTSLQCDGPRP